MNTAYSTELETTQLDRIIELADRDNFVLRLHIGGSENPSCALVPKNRGRSFVFPNLECLVRFLFDGELAVGKTDI